MSTAHGELKQLDIGLKKKLRNFLVTFFWWYETQKVYLLREYNIAIHNMSFISVILQRRAGIRCFDIFFS